jgi:tRNA pseudouridine55 synthase
MKDRPDGLLVLDKPGGITSRDAVDRALRWFGRGTRAGHTGTLDPLATGVLVLTLGPATRLTDYVQRMRKTYRAGVRLGARSDTDDADGSVTAVPGATPPDADAVSRAAAAFVGTLEQVPPAYSAAKLGGRRAYDLARGGEEVVLRPRPVQVYRIDVLSYAWPELELEVECGKGTYIRSLARDLGQRLGCGGYVRTLRRTRVGPFTAEMGLSPDADAAAARARLLPAAMAVAELPAVRLPEALLGRLRQGQVVPLPAGVPAAAGEVAVLNEAGGLAAVAVAGPGGQLRPAKVLPG